MSQFFPGLSTSSGAYVEFFTGQTTDAAGKVALTLSRTPASSNVFVLTDKDERRAAVFSVAGVVVTVLCRKTQYDKADSPVSIPSNLPSGTSSDNTVGGTIYTASAASAAAVAPAAGVGAAVTPAHTHTVTANKIIEHKHTLTYTTTSQAVAASEGSFNFVVIYR